MAAGDPIERLRLFVAVRPPPEAVLELAAALAPVRAEYPGLRWADAGQWHLTLTFLADVRPRQRAELAVRLARAAGRCPPIELGFGPAGRFGDRVLFASVTGDRASLVRLAASTTAAARRSGIEVEDRAYRPHLTLARAVDAQLRPLVAALAGFQGASWIAGELELVRSRLGQGPGGSARHETIETWPLTGRAADPKGR